MPTATLFCSEADLQRLFSVYGVTSYADHDESGLPDPGVVTDCITQASQELEMQLGMLYTTAALASSPLVTRWATVLSTVFLCMRRGNSPPESLLQEADRVRGLVQAVVDKEAILPGVALRGGVGPRFSNLDVDRRFVTNTPRVVDGTGDPKTYTEDSSVPWVGRRR